MSLLQRLSFNQMTADPWSLKQTVHNCSRSGIPFIGVWRHKLGGDAAKASAIIRDEGLRVSSLCRGGWFSAATIEERRKRVRDNFLAIEEAALLGAPVLVIVSGPADGQTLDDARATVLDGLLEVLPHAEKAGVEAIDRRGSALQIKFHPGSKIDPARLMELVSSQEGAQFTPAGVLRLPLPGSGENAAILEFLQASLETLAPAATYN